MTIEPFDCYSIEGVKLIKDAEGNEDFKEVPLAEAEEFILMGEYTNAHGILTKEGIFAGHLEDCKVMYYRITGKDYK